MTNNNDNILRVNHSTICGILDDSALTLRAFSAVLFEKKIIDRPLKNRVSRTAGFETADELLTHIAVMVEQQPELLDTVLDAMENQQLLRKVATDIKTKIGGKHGVYEPEEEPDTKRWEWPWVTPAGITILIIALLTYPVLIWNRDFLFPPNQTVPSDTDRHQDTDINDSGLDINERIWIAGEFGSDVVKKCMEKLKETGIFPDDKRFMERVAYVMSRNGDSAFELHTDGGIWQVSKYAFQDTKEETAHVRLPKKYQRLEDAFGIKWREATRVDLEIPMYSAIAARLYLSNFAEPIPPESQITKQQEYWWRFYMRDHESKRFMDQNDFKRDLKLLDLGKKNHKRIT